MTNEEIIEMARQAGIGIPITWRGKKYIEHGNAMLGIELEAFAKLVEQRTQVKLFCDGVGGAVAAEREACAKLADEMTMPDWANEQIAKAIRARGQA
jgi:hypothetical protein